MTCSITVIFPGLFRNFRCQLVLRFPISDCPLLIITYKKAQKDNDNFGRFYTRGHIIRLDELGRAFFIGLVIRL